MKYLLIPVFTIMFLFLSSDAMARRGIVPICTSCEYIEIVDDLPDTEDYLSDDNQHLDVGYMYKQFWLIWIPVWNYDGQYVLTNAAADTYYELTEEEMNTVLTENNLTRSSNPLSFWNKIGGKLVIGLILGGIIWGYASDSDDDEVGYTSTTEAS